MIPTTCSSVNLDVRIAPSIQGASLSTLRWAENPRAGHLKLNPLVLLCHKFMRRVVCWQQGQRGSVRAMARAIATRTDVMEFAM